MSFEFDAEKYRSASQHQQEWGQRLIGELGLGGNERIVELGCGDGRLTLQIARCVPDGFVLGIDASERMIALAQRIQQPNLRFERLDINWIDQPSLVPFLACVGERDHAAFRDAVVRWMVERTRQPDGRCFETFRRINLLARK